MTISPNGTGDKSYHVQMRKSVSVERVPQVWNSISHDMPTMEEAATFLCRMDKDNPQFEFRIVEKTIRDACQETIDQLMYQRQAIEERRLDVDFLGADDLKQYKASLKSKAQHWEDEADKETGFAEKVAHLAKANGLLTALKSLEDGTYKWPEIGDDKELRENEADKETGFAEKATFNYASDGTTDGPTNDTIRCFYCEAQAEAPGSTYPPEWGWRHIFPGGPYGPHYACPDCKD